MSIGEARSGTAACSTAGSIGHLLLRLIYQLACLIYQRFYFTANGHTCREKLCSGVGRQLPRRFELESHLGANRNRKIGTFVARAHLRANKSCTHANRRRVIPHTRWAKGGEIHRGLRLESDSSSGRAGGNPNRAIIKRLLIYGCFGFMP